MIRVDYLINKMIDSVNSATINLEDAVLEEIEDLFESK